jgi:hypothetical protein
MKALQPYDSLLIVQPLLGKILRQIAVFHMMNTQAIQSEGLFRSALEKLSSPLALHDSRFQFEKALTHGFYGQLLRKWDKRESSGETYQKESLDQIRQWKQQNMKISYFPLTSMIQFPSDYLR